MALLLKDAHVIDPQNGIDEVTNVLVRDGLVVAVGTDIELPEKLLVKDCTGKYLVPGMVDVHVHFRDPGQEYKEDIITGMRAAAHGGFTGVVPMANTNPVIDTGAGPHAHLSAWCLHQGACRQGACRDGRYGRRRCRCVFR